ncbi:AAA family ATPase [Prevotella sp.]|uniref:AAA family ATPase n=1 Tax=Prevotella sp. TaxID=59823 RepID=UPI0027E235E1|nr:ATP-binding protein [uncultured Prevotella sp.]
MKENIIGREQEIEKLENYISSRKSEFIAIYGRRRVGKTFLVKELFENRFAFRVTGKDNVITKEQLASFSFALNDQLGIEADVTNWPEAFRLLQKALEKMPDGTKIIFFDELPWFDTYASNFISALEHFWNDWAFYRSDIKLIACGSATTWMLNQVINSRGGLHNRITHNILLSPFKLHEVEEYFKSQGFYYERPEIIECYMAMGGVAYYLSLFETNKSVAQNIQQLCFTRGGELTEEFERLFNSLFKKADNHLAIVTALKNKGKGMTRLDLLDATGLANNGRFSQILKELEQCDFIRSYTPFGKSKKDMMYQLIDPFCLFYFKFMHNKGAFLDNHWVKMQTTAEYESWCGHAFEIVCLHHINEIVKALGIDGCINTPCSWSYRPTTKVLADEEADEDLKHGTQIDLLIDRSDRSISICEMKYCNGEYEISKAYDAHLVHRLKVFKKVTKTTKTLIPTFVTPHGLYNNMYARKINRQVTGNDLF